MDNNMNEGFDVQCGEVNLKSSEFQNYRLSSEGLLKCHGMNIRALMEAVEKMEIRDDDVFLLTYPKSGTHLLREIVHMIQVGRIEYTPGNLDFPIEYRHPDELARLESPRILHSHMWFMHLPKQIKEEKRGKVIALFRNPKDVVVSYWHFLSKRYNTELPQERFVDMLISGQVYGNSWYEWRNSLVEAKRKYGNFPILTITFEDYMENAKEEISKIAEYLGKQISVEFIDQIVKACEIKKMREEKIKNQPKDVTVFFKNGYEAFYRKGTIGDWKTTLSPKANEVLDQWISSQEDDEFPEFPNYKSYYT